MFHSIIIPHRNRNRQLRWCVWSIRRSAWACGLRESVDYEIIVADGGSRELPMEILHPAQPLVDHDHPETFNKPRLQNKGIEIALADADALGDIDPRHHVLTFLDGDMLVGKHWMYNSLRLTLSWPELGTPIRRLGRVAPPITRQCFRVRQLGQDHDNPNVILSELEQQGSDPEVLVDGWFACYQDFQKAAEEYVATHKDSPMESHSLSSDGSHVMGNSQFSITRAMLTSLGDPRYDEAFEGAGYEDLWFIRDLYRRAGANYRAKIMTEADQALLHIYHPRPMYPGEPWWSEEQSEANKKRFLTT